MSIATIITRGYGSFGSATDVVLRGFTPGIPYSGSWSGVVGVSQERATEGSLVRAVETGEYRETGNISSDLSVLTAAGTLTTFAPLEAKNSGAWQAPTVKVKYSGSWVTPLKGYIYDSGIWKRIY